MGRRTETGSEATPKQGERAVSREALVVEARRRKSGGRVEKDGALTWGDLASCLKGQRACAEREVSRGRSRPRCEAPPKDRTKKRTQRTEVLRAHGHRSLGNQSDSLRIEVKP